MNSLFERNLNLVLHFSSFPTVDVSRTSRSIEKEPFPIEVRQQVDSTEKEHTFERYIHSSGISKRVE